MDIERIKQIAREKHGMKMTDEMAAKYMEKYADKLGKLSDDELDNVTGGYCPWDKEWFEGKYCERCEVWCDRYAPEGSSWQCPQCNWIYS